MAEQINVQTPGTPPQAVPGTMGLETQLPNQAITVDGIGGGVGDDLDHLSQVAIDESILRFKSNVTPLMTLMLKSKLVPIDSPEVAHFMIDEARSVITTTGQVAADALKQQFTLTLSPADAALCLVCDTLLCRGVNGYTADGKNETPGLPLMLYVIGRNTDTGMPIVRALNGKRTNPTDGFCQVPLIPTNTTIDILANALHETQREVEPSASQPVPRTLFLQKRGTNIVWSDYYDKQKKIVDFSKSIIAEADLDRWKKAGNRTLWIGRQAKFTVRDPKTGYQIVRTTEGVRWQFTRELIHNKSKWTYEEFVALAKMFYCGDDQPESAICLCGKNFLENIQCIDFSKHPEVNIDVKTGKLGWDVHCIHTAFGDFEFTYEPTMDKIGFANSCGIFGFGRLVHYQYSGEEKKEDDIDGYDAKRSSITVWDGLGLKGTCHIFVNGEGTQAPADAVDYVYWDSSVAPAGADLVDGRVYVIMTDCTLGDHKAIAGEYWEYKSTAWNKLAFEDNTAKV